ncbi:FecR family protein [Chitinophaga sp. YR573]|uniref:FecR domain-containing protein n=1 Tax=Chitinophaga sp. YR573 TaxID=1881040 RepID=UPI0008CF7FDE|nr:FecR domain-containing protein [Chitinophaga sp. YR573]SEW02692.1 FecR family protein [Chitinophaga sp. YR573]
MLYSEEALYTLLCKYVLSEADAEERLWVEEWLQTDSRHPQLLAALEKVLRQIPYKEDAVAAEIAWQRLSAKMEGNSWMEETNPIEERLQIEPKRNTWWMAAAIFVLAAGAGLWWIAGRSNRSETFTGPVMAQLKDGSTIELDSLAQLEVLPGFGNRQRLVKLTGKAVFDVTPDAVHPFIVKLGEREVKVLGTKFTIDCTDKGFLRVHVNSGRVMVKDNRDSVVLSTGMLLEHQAGQSAKVAGHVMNAEKKELVFADTPLSEVLQTIAVVYNKEVTVDSVLLGLPVTATFTGEPVENVLSAITFMTNTTIIQHASGIELKKHEE